MKPRLTQCIGAVIACGMISAAHAGTFTDNFNVSRNYLTQGVAGSPYQGITSGEISPVPITACDANITAANTLTITNSGGNWRATGDGPFLWTMVNGDFTNTVHLTDMSQLNYNMAGLMVRNASTNTGQNYVFLGLFAEFNLALVYRNTIDGGDSDQNYTTAGFLQDDKATWPGWLQIVRQGTLITLNASVDNTNWEMVAQMDRPDLPVDVQVGIFDSTYTANENYAQFQNFKVEGPNVGAITPPSPASSLTVTPQTKSLVVSWTPGAGSAGSAVLVRRGLPITRQPMDGTNYIGAAVFGSGDNLGESNYVAYVGSGSSVTITNVTPAVPYSVAVYAYSGSGASTVYAVSNAPFATAEPLGNPVGISIWYGATNAVAVDDTLQAQVLLHFDSGDEVTVSGATFVSSDTNKAPITAGGLVSGLANGTVSISATYQSFNTSSNLNVVKLPVSDDFSVAKNYLSDGIAGTPWHGMTLGASDSPSGALGDGPGTTLLANAGITKAGRFTVQSTQTGFDSAEDDGFFLYRVIRGDFSVSVQITSFNNTAYHMPGLMARAPFEFAFTENSLALVSFNEFGIANFVRAVLNGSKAEVAQQSGAPLPFIMIQRQTNTFKFYQKAHAFDSWTLIWTEERPDLDGVPMQVGIVDQDFTANTGTAEFDNINFVGSTINSPSAPANGPSNLSLNSTQNGQVAVSWTPAAGSAGSVVIAHPSTSATRQPADGDDYSTTASPDVTVALNLGGSNIVVFAGSGNSVTASNLPPRNYSFSVYSYATVSGTNYYNILNPATGNLNVLGQPVIDADPPAAIVRYQGQSISISAQASPAAYRWQKDGADVQNGGRVSGASTATLTINSLIGLDAGNYTFVATNSVGSITSAPAALTVLVPTNSSELSVLAYHPTAFWRFEEISGLTAYDYVGGHDATHGPSDVLGVNGPRPSDGFSHFESGNLASQYLGNDIASAATFPGLTAGAETVANLTVTAWINPVSIPSDRAGIVTFGAPADSGLRLYGGGNGLSILWGGSAVSHTSLVPPVGQWSFIAMVISPSGAKVYLATAGGWQTYSDSNTRGALSLSGTGSIGSDRAIAGRYFEGVIDDVAIYESALSGAAITNLFNGTIAPPVVTLDIANVIGGVQLTWPQGTLLEATNVSGPWTTNSATSPYTINNPAGNKYFRVRVQ